MNISHSKHEQIQCERCQTTFECKANSSTYCQCTQVSLGPEEAEYIQESFENCLCADCLKSLKKEFQDKKFKTKHH